MNASSFGLLDGVGIAPRPARRLEIVRDSRKSQKDEARRGAIDAATGEGSAAQSQGMLN